MKKKPKKKAENFEYNKFLHLTLEKKKTFLFPVYGLRDFFLCKILFLTYATNFGGVGKISHVFFFLFVKIQH